MEYTCIRDNQLLISRACTIGCLANVALYTINPMSLTSPRINGAKMCVDDHRNWMPPHVKAITTALEEAVMRKFPLVFQKVLAHFDQCVCLCLYLHPIQVGKLLANCAFGGFELEQEEY